MLELLLRLAGIGQIVLVVLSPFVIPRALGWSAELAKLRPLTRQTFWTYAAYILCFNLSFGLVSAFAPRLLIDGSRLGLFVSAFIALYWAARVVIQFTYYDRSAAPPGRIFALGEWALVALFVFLTAVYAAATLADLGMIAI